MLLPGVVHKDFGRLAMVRTNRRILSVSSVALGLARVAGYDLVLDEP